MKSETYIKVLFQPAAVRERAAEQSSMAAVGINAVYGMAAFIAFAMAILSMLTAGFVVSATVLFGPLLGFIVSSLYARVEMSVGRRLGGRATLDELYRFFAWSYLPAGLALLLAALLFSLTSTMLKLIVFLPILILFCCGIRNYCSSVITAHGFTLARGLTCVVLTFILFIVLVTAGIGLVSILFRSGGGESLAAIFCQP